MKPFYLKFKDESQAAAAMPHFRTEDDGGWCVASLNHALDIVGEIPDCEGFHVNLMLSDLPTDLEGFAVFPKTPNRVFAGVN